MSTSALPLHGPWPGPRPYTEAEQERFFGRMPEVNDLLKLIQNHPFTVLSAWSGAGKSSLIQAGLLPALRRAQRGAQAGFTLLVREWSTRAGRSPGKVLVEAVADRLRTDAGMFAQQLQDRLDGRVASRDGNRSSSRAVEGGAGEAHALSARFGDLHARLGRCVTAADRHSAPLTYDEAAALSAGLAELLADLAARARSASDQAHYDDIRALARDLVLAQQMRQVPVPPLVDRDSLSEDDRRRVVGYLADLEEITAGLVLIVDQAEELMGAGFGAPDLGREGELLAIFGGLYKAAPGIHTLISLREEYVGRLRPLSLYVDGLDKRTIALEPLARGRAEEVIRSTLEHAEGLEMPPESVRELLDWLPAPNALAAEEPTEAPADKPLAERPVDLLRMQALLVDMLREAREQTTTGPARLDVEFLHQYLRNHAAGRRPSDLARFALERYLERVLASVEVPHSPGYGVPTARRIAARLGPWLSSPGNFKRPSEECELLYNVLREDLEGAGYAGTGEQAVEAIAVWTRCRFEHDPPLRFIAPAVGGAVPWASGVACTWEPAGAQLKVFRELVRAGTHALGHLVAHSVLKRTQMRRNGSRESTVIYELVHDGFGGALAEYGEKERLTVHDTLAALVSQRGRNFRWPEAQGTLDNMCWVGCNMIGTTFKEVTFNRCILKGTIFIDCRFIDCRFVDCDLDGTVFSGAGTQLVRTLVSGGHAYSALFGGVLFEDASFAGVQMEGATFKRVRLGGGLTLTGTSLAFSQLRRFTRQPEDGREARVVFDDCDLRNSLLEDRGEQWVVLDASANATDNIVERMPPRVPQATAAHSPAGSAG